jgi:hypothetical protein
MEKLQMLKFSIRKEEDLNFTDGLQWTEELKELERLQKDAAPSDPLAYQRSLQVIEDDGDSDWEDEDPDDDDGGGDQVAMARERGAEQDREGGPRDEDIGDGLGGRNEDEFFDIYDHDGELDDDDEGLYANF